MNLVLSLSLSLYLMSCQDPEDVEREQMMSDAEEPLSHIDMHMGGATPQLTDMHMGGMTSQHTDMHMGGMTSQHTDMHMGDMHMGGDNPQLVDMHMGGEELDMITPADEPDALLSSTTRLIRAECFIGEAIDTMIDPLPTTCADIYRQRPDLESGCYLLDDGDGIATSGYCWRQRALILLVNNELETPPHPDDLDSDGVIDQGELAGRNFPLDPFLEEPALVASHMREEIKDYFQEISYGALVVESDDIYWVEGEEGLPDRWYRLQQLRPGFANTRFMRDVCLRRGGMSATDWHRFDFIITVVNYGTTTSGSQWRVEDLPIGEDCDQSIPIQGNYIVMKQFRSWGRLGTLFHEIAHALHRDPLPEPSIGHSESIHVETGEYTEYGDLTDVMGSSSKRGHLSLPQKLFLRYLPEDLIDVVSVDQPIFESRITPLASPLKEKKGLRVEVEEGMAYYVEARRAIGNNARISEVFHHGVLIKQARSISRANKSYIVDPTPETPSANSRDHVLFPQRTFTDLEQQVYITVLESDILGADVVIRRGPPSSTPPSINMIQVITSEEGTLRLIVHATSSDPMIPQSQLLYFWKRGAQNTFYQGDDYLVGAEVTLSAEEAQDPLWLIVSDQRGGETWRQVLPLE